eukprot:scaffold2576_cov265-Chaetoceros_neogracile.AAC.7
MGISSLIGWCLAGRKKAHTTHLSLETRRSSFFIGKIVRYYSGSSRSVPPPQYPPFQREQSSSNTGLSPNYPPLGVSLARISIPPGGILGELPL